MFGALDGQKHGRKWFPREQVNVGETDSGLNLVDFKKKINFTECSRWEKRKDGGINLYRCFTNKEVNDAVTNQIYQILTFLRHAGNFKGNRTSYSASIVFIPAKMLQLVVFRPRNNSQIGNKSSFFSHRAKGGRRNQSLTSATALS